MGMVSGERTWSERKQERERERERERAGVPYTMWPAPLIVRNEIPWYSITEPAILPAAKNEKKERGEGRRGAAGAFESFCFFSSYCFFFSYS